MEGTSSQGEGRRGAPVAIGGGPLAIADVVAVARHGTAVVLAPGARERMDASRAVALEIAARGDAVYGLTTSVGVRKRVRVDQVADSGFNLRLLRDHRIAQGGSVEPAAVRATMLLLANGLARGHAGVRPRLVERLLEALDAPAPPTLRELGSTGQGDLAQLADLALALFEDEPLEAKEGLALLSSNAYGTALAALAADAAEVLLHGLVLGLALDLEAFRGSVTTLHPAVLATRAHPGLHAVVASLRRLLEGSALWAPGAARNLQDPLSFRNGPEVLGAATQLGRYALDVVRAELASSQENPLVLVDERRAISVANFEPLALVQALDALRLALAPPVLLQMERFLKLLQAPLSGLGDGLAPPGRPDQIGLSELAFAVQALGAEAKLLAAPVSLEMGSSTQAEGIEDRISLLPLGGRRLAEQVDRGTRVLALGLVGACQAIDLRGDAAPLGPPLRAAHAAVRAHVPALGPGASLPETLEPLVEDVARGALAGLARALAGPPISDG